MNRGDIFLRVVEAIALCVDRDRGDIFLNTKKDTLTHGSAQDLRVIIAAIERQFTQEGVNIPLRDANNMVTVSDMVDFIDQQINPQD